MKKIPLALVKNTFDWSDPRPYVPVKPKNNMLVIISDKKGSLFTFLLLWPTGHIGTSVLHLP